MLSYYVFRGQPLAWVGHTIRNMLTGVKKGALIIGTRLWGPFYYNYSKEPPNGIGTYLGPYIRI